MKRIFDILVCLILLVPALAIALPIALLIYRYDWRSPIYSGSRVGKGGILYRQYKLRSMVVNADKIGVDATSANDTRITPLGHLIRRRKLDEIPQLWNVLRGDMSLVGPRPNCVREYEMYSPEEKQILTIKPGITDISSIVFFDEQFILKSALDPDLGYHQLIRPWKSRMGLLYLKKRSLWLDFALLGLTAVVLFSHRHALMGLQPILRHIGADEQLLKVAQRQQPLMPYPPPGLPTIIAEIPGKQGVIEEPGVMI